MKNDINKKRSEVFSLSPKRHIRTRVCDLRTRIASADSTIQKLKKIHEIILMVKILMNIYKWLR
jgi:hypothetical protein